MTIFAFMLAIARLLLFFTKASSANDILTRFQSLPDGRTLVSRNKTFELGFFSPGDFSLGMALTNNPEMNMWNGSVEFHRSGPWNGVRFSNTFIEKKSGVDAEEDMELPLFDLASLVKATDDFSIDNKLGQGGFGPVYKCDFRLVKALPHPVFNCSGTSLSSS
ncbi:hypothetical protein RJT34_30274 [Clitoria ternatea]|uniref:Uncharacterized protein n=1 Tax=Clitoria ternatea TaxID=43366 RepID=A0AAN9EZS6_CLITE